MGEKVCEVVIQGEMNGGKSPWHQDTGCWEVDTTVLVCQTGKVCSRGNIVDGSKVDAGSAFPPSGCC